jgi:hypothetical protein
MGEQTYIARVGERFSSHTQMRSRPRARSTSGDPQMLRERLIQAIVEVIAEGSDPRLGKSRAQA